MKYITFMRLFRSVRFCHFSRTSLIINNNKIILYAVPATGEPAFCLGTVFMHAVREAVRDARKDAGYDDIWFDIGKSVREITNYNNYYNRHYLYI